MTNDTIKKVVERLLNNVKQTAKELNIENNVYHSSFYQDETRKNISKI